MRILAVVGIMSVLKNTPQSYREGIIVAPIWSQMKNSRDILERHTSTAMNPISGNMRCWVQRKTEHPCGGVLRVRVDRGSRIGHVFESCIAVPDHGGVGLG
jgi:hypothetical protein